MADKSIESIPPKYELSARAVGDHPFTQDETKDGPVATAQSIHEKQQRLFQRAGNLGRKPAGEITEEDAAEY